MAEINISFKNEENQITVGDFDHDNELPITIEEENIGRMTFFLNTQQVGKIMSHFGLCLVRKI